MIHEVLTIVSYCSCISLVEVIHFSYWFLWIFSCFYFSLVGAPVGARVAICEWSGMAATPVALQAMPCTLFYESDIFESIPTVSWVSLIYFYWAIRKECCFFLIWIMPLHVRIFYLVFHTVFPLWEMSFCGDVLQSFAAIAHLFWRTFLYSLP